MAGLFPLLDDPPKVYMDALLLVRKDAMLALNVQTANRAVLIENWELLPQALTVDPKWPLMMDSCCALSTEYATETGDTSCDDIGPNTFTVLHPRCFIFYSTVQCVLNGLYRPPNGPSGKGKHTKRHSK